jgi:hypothetical protein
MPAIDQHRYLVVPPRQRRRHGTQRQQRRRADALRFQISAQGHETVSITLVDESLGRRLQCSVVTRIMTECCARGCHRVGVAAEAVEQKSEFPMGLRYAVCRRRFQGAARRVWLVAGRRGGPQLEREVRRQPSGFVEGREHGDDFAWPAVVTQSLGEIAQQIQTLRVCFDCRTQKRQERPRGTISSYCIELPEQP